MASVLAQLDAPDFKATKSDRILLSYVKENIEAFSHKPISQLAEESGIGESTITRFAKKMGFTGLQEFKLALAREATLSGRRCIISSGIENAEPAKETAKKLLNSNVINLENTVDIMQSADVHHCAQLMIAAKRIYFIGIGYSGIIAQDSNYKFMRIGLNSVSFDNSHTMYMIASIMDAGDLIVAISHSGETEEIIDTVEMARANGASVISVTEHKKSRLKEISDAHLAYVSGETTLETGSISSKMAQFFLMDLVYTQVVKELSGRAIEKKIKTTKAIEKLKSRKSMER